MKRVSLPDSESDAGVNGLSLEFWGLLFFLLLFFFKLWTLTCRAPPHHRMSPKRFTLVTTQRYSLLAYTSRMRLWISDCRLLALRFWIIIHRSEMNFFFLFGFFLFFFFSFSFLFSFFEGGGWGFKCPVVLLLNNTHTHTHTHTRTHAHKNLSQMTSSIVGYSKHSQFCN